MEIIVASGVVSSGLSVTQPNSLDVVSGGTAISNVISGAALFVSAGGVAVANTVAAGTVIVAGTAAGTIVEDNASLQVTAGGVSLDTAVENA